MEIQENKHEAYITLKPVGDLDANSSIQMDEKIQEQIDQEIYCLHIDCSGLQYISSAGLGVFISFFDELIELGGKFVFSDMSDNVRKVFQLLGLEQLVTIVGTATEVEEAFL